MEKEKYYTPTIEELNVNQEVYLLDTGNYKASYSEGDVYPMLVIITQLTDYPTIWVKTKGNEKGYKVYEVYPDQIGLKYLDREDIESLGFESVITKSIGKDHYTMSGEKSTLGNLLLEHDWLNDKITIKTPNYIRDGSGRLDGYIIYVNRLKCKNKSEFSRLLKQLSII